MAVTYRIAVIGDWESVMGFRALGLDTYPVTSPEEAREKIRELAKTDCAVIYLTETLAKDLEDVLERYPELEDILNRLAGCIPTEQMAELTYQVDVVGHTVEEVALEFLKEQGLIG